uniref:Macaca fascicularis brain cDNA clone: QflA-22762, similar to human O-acyltransferase (membrane bound) domain containing 1(OACT1), mRNA, RefSeq: XM_371801.2 n=1 Tax=Macaca fascicularis TaxID=9541 RepID=I7GNX1_MACFA|nr:unnamed protein product [Macaca fascicularis]
MFCKLKSRRSVICGEVIYLKKIVLSFT